MKKPITDLDAFRKVFIKNNLRIASLRWPPRGEALKRARTSQKINPATGRLCWHVLCAGCQREFIEREVKLDHIQPVVSVVSDLQEAISPTDREKSLGTYVLRMLPDVSGFQPLCGGCHDSKTARERDQRTEARREVKRRDQPS